LVYETGEPWHAVEFGLEFRHTGSNEGRSAGGIGNSFGK
jgi:hypothetical protein